MKKSLVFLSAVLSFASCKKPTQSHVRTDREVLNEPGFEKMISCKVQDSDFVIKANGRKIRLVKDNASGSEDTLTLDFVSHSRQPISTTADKGGLFSNTYIFNNDKIELTISYPDKYIQNGRMRLSYKDNSGYVIECSENFDANLTILEKTVEAIPK